VYWVTEQPVSSLAQYLPYLEMVLYPAKLMIGFASGLFQKFWMGLMGHRSLKRTVIFGDAPWIFLFSLGAKVTAADRNKFKWNSEGNVRVTKKSDGTKKRVSGSGGPNLKETQSYPATFCSKVASYHKKYCIESWLIMFEIILLIVGANPQEELFGW
ncbi:unnamed protein product, partial [Durusdinium trenchii]